MSDKDKKYEWFTPEPTKDVIRDFDVRKVTLPVNCIFRWSDKIPDEIGEDGGALTYKSGFIMEVLPGQIFVHEGQETVFLCHTAKMKP